MQCSENVNHIVAIYALLANDLALHRIDFCHSYAQLLKHLMERCGAAVERLPTADKSLSKLQMIKTVNDVETHYRRLLVQQQQLTSDDYWDETKENKEKKVRMSYKKMKDGSLKVRSNFQTEVNLFNFLSLINEVDLYPEWIPFCKKSFIVTPSHPVQRHQRLLQSGAPRLQHRQAVLLPRDLHHRVRLGPALPQRLHLHRVQVHPPGEGC